MIKLPQHYAWLNDEPGPRILKTMLALHGTKEVPGIASNKTIMDWAKRVGVSRTYTDDSIPWCGLGMAYVALESGWDIPVNPLWARNWATWGHRVDPDKAMLGDVLVFARGSAGHVADYVGEDATHFHIIGCNQDDCVSIKRRAKAQLLAARRCPWRVNQPPNVRKVWLAATGSIAKTEA
jgi:uncharacterized protein (TIGR02594 family)